MLQKYNILKENIYNFNKTSFKMGVIITTKVVRGTKKRGHTKPI